MKSTRSGFAVTLQLHISRPFEIHGAPCFMNLGHPQTHWFSQSTWPIARFARSLAVGIVPGCKASVAMESPINTSSALQTGMVMATWIWSLVITWIPQTPGTSYRLSSTSAFLVAPSKQSPGIPWNRLLRRWKAGDVGGGIKWEPSVTGHKKIITKATKT